MTGDLVALIEASRDAAAAFTEARAKRVILKVEEGLRYDLDVLSDSDDDHFALAAANDARRAALAFERDLAEKLHDAEVSMLTGNDWDWATGFRVRRPQGVSA